jgi:ABC-type dipeptide/oligopeptide/nickel transport system permease subunit
MDKFKKINSSDFKFAQKDSKIYDQKFQTKPIGYFKDAMIRFAKNKINVTASIILLSIFSLSVFVPIFSQKNFTDQIPELSYLPPRIPIVENLGFLDGYRTFRDQISDGTKIDEETGLFLPNNYLPQYIDMSTLKNEIVLGSLKDPNYIGGTNIMQTDFQSESISIKSNTTIILSNSNKIEIDIKNISSLGGEVLTISLLDTSNKITNIGTTTQVGKQVFALPETIAFGMYNIGLKLDSTQAGSFVELNSLSVLPASGNNPEYFVDGYKLSLYTIDGGAGNYSRLNASVIRTSFKYNVYEARLKDLITTSLGSEVYEKILEDNPEMVSGAIIDPNNPNGLIFPEGSPLTKMISRSSPIRGPDGTLFYSYTVQFEYGNYFGFDELPYFFFGTDSNGKDMFALTWVGIRTSLLIGIIVSMINILIGVIFGAISGYYGGTTDLLMERFSEIIGRIPWLVTLSIFSSLFGPGILTLVLILVVSGWLGVAGVTRSQFYRYKGREYVLASRTLGANDTRLIFRHILPNGIGTIITASILMIPGVIFTESTIAYLGYGLGDGQVIDLGFIQLSGTSLGVLLNNGRTALDVYPYLTVWPAIIVSILMITFNMFGNALRDAFNPSLRGVEE